MDKLDLQDKFAIAHPTTFKKAIMVRLKVRKGKLKGLVQNNSAAVEPDVIDLNEDELVCIFPNDSPAPGKVYNCDVDPFYKAMKANKWGNIYYYRNLADAEQKNFTRALELVYTKFIKPNKISHVLPIDLEIRANTGTKQGYYRHANKTREHVICLCPTSFVGSGNTKELQALLAHEIGHPLWTVFLDDKYKERWIELYATFSIIQELTTTDLSTAHSHFLESKELPSQYRKSLEDQPKIIFNAILKYIKNNHRLKLEHLDLMVKEKNSDLKKFWPKSKVQLSEIQNPVSKYANKAPVELWCESLSAYAIKAELPANISKLVKKTLFSLRAK